MLGYPILKHHIDDANDLNILGHENGEAVGLHSNASGYTVWMEDDEVLIKTIDALAEIAERRGLLAPSKPIAPDASDETAQALTAPPFHPLPVESTPAVVLQDVFVLNSGCSRDAVAYVLSGGLLVLEPISNQRDTIENVQFGTDDLRAMLALKERK